jgi:hypothetical protein
MTSLPEFLKDVAAMRLAQKDFFHNHSQQALDRAKRLETKVDRLLLEMLGRYVAQSEALPGFEKVSETPVKGL